MKYSYLIRSAGIFSVLLGSVVLIMWLMDIPALRDNFGGYATIKLSTSVCFVLYGVSLLLYGKRSVLKYLYIASGIVALIAVLMILQ